MSQIAKVFPPMGTKSVNPKDPVSLKGVKVTPPTPSYWETEIEIVSCGVNSKPVDIIIGPTARGKIDFLMNKFPKMEWLAYLTGTKEPWSTDAWYIDDIIIPKQSVSVVSVHVSKEGVNAPTIGVIHSHHDMGNKFSHTDDEYINQNHDISLCVSHGGINGHVRQRTECGRYSLTPVNIKEQYVGVDIGAFESEIDKNITVNEYKYTKGVLTQGIKNFRKDDWDEYIADMQGFGVPGYENQTIEKRVYQEADSYLDMIKSVEMDMDLFTEMDILSALLGSIGTETYPAWEETAFTVGGAAFTTNFYNLIDEISAHHDELTERDQVKLKQLDIVINELMSEDE